MQEKHENGYLSFMFHYDGIGIETPLGTYSCRISNIPANLNSLFSYTGAGAYAFFNYVGVNAMDFFWFNLNQNQQYIFQKEDDYFNSKLTHVWQMILDKNPCNFSSVYKLKINEFSDCLFDIYCALDQKGIVYDVNSLSWQGYVYNKIISWHDADLYQRWLDPVNKTLENCIAPIIEMASTQRNITRVFNSSNVDSTSIFSYESAGYLCLFGLGFTALRYVTNSNAEGCLGKSKAKTPSFSERLEQFDTEIPKKFICPISRTIMEDPILLDDGHFYDRAQVQEYIKLFRFTRPKCPQDSQVYIEIRPYPVSFLLQNEIEEFVSQVETSQLQAAMK